MKRNVIQNLIDELMQQYSNGEIDSATYAQRMMELTSAAQADDDDE